MTAHFFRVIIIGRVIYASHAEREVGIFADKIIIIDHHASSTVEVDN